MVRLRGTTSRSWPIRQTSVYAALRRGKQAGTRRLQQPLGDHESAFWFGDRCAVFLRCFEPESDRFLGMGDRFGAGVPMSHATGKLRNIDDEGVIFVAPPDDHFVTSIFHDSKKFILSQDFSHLFYLIRLSLRSLALQVDAFHNSRLCEDMMAAGNAHPKAFRLQ
jgi:hypothetical protein